MGLYLWHGYILILESLCILKNWALQSFGTLNFELSFLNSLVVIPTSPKW